ncbi:MAG: hypothetical protein ABSB31_08610 [Dehalococcoidia bacterium]|jgi:hypothetical protein
MHIKHSTHMLDVQAVPDGIERMETLETLETLDTLDIVEVMEGTTIRRYLRENGGEKHA